jgi:two-component system response regulator FixJ
MVSEAPHRRVAVVDDDFAVRESLRFLLETAGFAVATYGSAGEYLDAPPDDVACLLLDQHMPQVTGLELLTRLRQAGAAIKVALMTGSPSADLERRARELGVVWVLEKPLSDNRLLDFVACAVH